MASLNFFEKSRLEKLFEMDDGYVLDFGNSRFSIFFADYNIDIYADKYNITGTSKAKRLRAFWTLEDDYLVGKVIQGLINWALESSSAKYSNDEKLINECRQIVMKLQKTSLHEIQILTPSLNEPQDERILKENILNAIKDNKPQSALDRLHTFTYKFMRQLCKKYDIEITKNKPLHSLLGEYIKKNHIESQMTERILKMSISLLESFNQVRNDKSLAHDNILLNKEESLFIYRNIMASIDFIKVLEDKKSSSLECESLF